MTSKQALPGHRHLLIACSARRIRQYAVLALLFSLIVGFFLTPGTTVRADSSGRKYLLAIGTGSFTDKMIKPLDFSAGDARAFYNIMKHNRYGVVSPHLATVLTDEKATAGAIRGKLKQIAEDSKESDTVFVYISSHGLQDVSGTTHFLTFNTKIDPATSRIDPGTSLDDEDITQLLNDIKAGQVLVLLDVSYSLDTVLSPPAGARTMIARNFQTRATDPFACFKENGRVVITSSDGKEAPAGEGELSQSAFSHYLIEGLKGKADNNKDNIVEVLELWKYLQHQSEESTRATGKSQNPTFSPERFAHGFPVTTYPLLSPEKAKTKTQTFVPNAPFGIFPLYAPEQKPERASLLFPDGEIRSLSPCEITNKQFHTFLEACPQWRNGSIDSRHHDGDYLKHWRNNSFPLGKDDFPVIYVSWYSAKAYAEWSGGRLPLEWEWELFAGDKTLFPWGSRWDPEKANAAGSGARSRLADVRSYPQGVVVHSGVSVFNMAGNAWEWCADISYVDGALGRVIKGGSYLSPSTGCMIKSRLSVDPTLCSDDGGFRVLFDN